MNTLINLFKKYRSIGVVGNPHTAKSSLVLGELINLKKQINIEVYVLGSEVKLHKYLKSKGIQILYSSDDILDMKIKGAILYIDEFSDLYDTRMASKQTEKIKKFFNRIAHLDNYVIISSAEVNFWNKFMCSLVKAHLVKTIEYDNLVRGTHLQRKVKNISEGSSEYRLEIPINVYYIVTDEDLVRKKTFEYNVDIDSKKDLVNPFLKLETKVENKIEKKVEKVEKNV